MLQTITLLKNYSEYAGCCLHGILSCCRKNAYPSFLKTSVCIASKLQRLISTTVEIRVRPPNLTQSLLLLLFFLLFFFVVVFFFFFFFFFWNSRSFWSTVLLTSCKLDIWNFDLKSWSSQYPSNKMYMNWPRIIHEIKLWAQLFKTNNFVSWRTVKIMIITYGRYANIFADKMWVAFAFTKATHIFFSKNICEWDIVFNRAVNILTTNELVKLTMLWTTGPSSLTEISSGMH